VLLEIPTFDEVRQLLVAAFSGRLPKHNVDKTSGNFKRLSVVALGIADLHYQLRQVHLDVMVDTSTKAALRRWAKIWGLKDKGASGSAKSFGLRVFGTVGETVGVGEELRHVASGMRFETRSEGTIAVAGFVDVDIAALDTGAKTNLSAGEELQFQTPPAGISAVARVASELENGRKTTRKQLLISILFSSTGYYPLNYFLHGREWGDPLPLPLLGLTQ